MTATRYSLWLRPASTVADRFKELIDGFSRRLGTPRFEPHITLSAVPPITEADTISRAQQLAAQLAPVPIHLVGAGHTDAYFRCLYLRVERTAQLLGAHRAAAALMQQPVKVEFMPHLSLVYGTLAVSVKENIIEEIDARFPRNFLADSVSLCIVTAAPAEWRSIGPFSLTGRAV